VPIFVANFVSTTAGLLLSFTLNRNFTFRLRTGEVRNQAFWFFAVTGFVLWAMQPIAITLINSLFPGINVLIPKSAGIAVGFDMEFRPVQQGGFSPAARGHS
jgi:putative flippase GtrA